MQDQPPQVIVTVRPAREGRVTGWRVKCSGDGCEALSALCRRKGTAQVLAQAHSRHVHDQAAVIAAAIK